MCSLAEIQNAYLAESPEARGEKCFHWPFYYEFLGDCQNITVNIHWRY